jgi:hypothetical protein
MTAAAHWFAHVGAPLAAIERAHVDAMFAADPLLTDATLDVVADWERAERFLRTADFDSTWWNHEEEERERLWHLALLQHTEDAIARTLADAHAAAIEDIRAAAHAAAARLGFDDDVGIAEATEGAAMAVHQHALAVLAGEGDAHFFAHKHALYAAGRWPVGWHRGHYAVF